MCRENFKNSIVCRDIKKVGNHCSIDIKGVYGPNHTLAFNNLHCLYDLFELLGQWAFDSLEII